MMYRAGDHVWPADLPGRFLCRVVNAESFRIGSGISQILKLEPLEGPWPPGTCLIRLEGAVIRARREARSAVRRPTLRSAPPGSGRRATGAG